MTTETPNQMPDYSIIASYYVAYLHQHTWFAREADKYPHHPAIDKLLCRAAPIYTYVQDWQLLVREHPHVSEESSTQIAYTQNEDKGERDIQTRTSMGKYLKRHMPQCPDHLLRDYVSQFINDGQCHITRDHEKMLDIIMNGPQSCMDGRNFNDYEDHPYNVYAPVLGWGMAYRTVNGEYHGRALVNIHRADDGSEEKIFVRSYCTTESSGYSQRDPALEGYLGALGFRHECSWEGCNVTRIAHNHESDVFLMPYIDGEVQRVEDRGETAGVMRVTDNGDYDASCTCGHTMSVDREACASCGDDTASDDLHAIGYHGDESVCCHCLENRYVHVYGRQCEQYYVHCDDAVWCESDDEWYHDRYAGDNDVYYVENEGGYYHSRDIWTCAGSDVMHHDDTPYYEVDGDTYHEDHLPDGWKIDENGVVVETATAETETTPELHTCMKVPSESEIDPRMPVFLTR